MTPAVGPGRALPEETLRRARVFAIALAVGPVLLAAVAVLSPRLARLPALVAPSALAGLLALPVALRVHHHVRDRASGGGSAEARAEAYVRSILGALAVTEAGAIFGLFAFLLSRHPYCLSGLATHVILVGAIWPSRESVARALDPRGEDGRTP